MPLPVLRDKLKAIVSERGSIYQMISAIILTFEDDGSGAQEDAVTPENCFRNVFGITDTYHKVALRKWRQNSSVDINGCLERSHYENR